jgi:hypothetical protein
MADRAPGSVLTPRAGRPDSAASLDLARRDVSPVALHPTCAGGLVQAGLDRLQPTVVHLLASGADERVRRKAQPSLDTDSHEPLQHLKRRLARRPAAQPPSRPAAYTP